MQLFEWRWPPEYFVTHCNEAVNKNHIDVWDILRDELTVHLYLSLLRYLLETVPVSVLSPLCYHMIAEMVTMQKHIECMPYDYYQHLARRGRETMATILQTPLPYLFSYGRIAVCLYI